MYVFTLGHTSGFEQNWIVRHLHINIKPWFITHSFNKYPLSLGYVITTRASTSMPVCKGTEIWWISQDTVPFATELVVQEYLNYKQWAIERLCFSRKYVFLYLFCSLSLFKFLFPWNGESPPINFNHCFVKKYPFIIFIFPQQICKNSNIFYTIWEKVNRDGTKNEFHSFFKQVNKAEISPQIKKNKSRMKFSNKILWITHV